MPDIAVGEADTFLNVFGSEQRPVDDGFSEVRGVFGDVVDEPLAVLLSHLRPWAIGKVRREVVNPQREDVVTFGCDCLVVYRRSLKLDDGSFSYASVLSIVPSVLTLVDRRAEGHHRQVLRVEVGAEVAREVGKLLHGAEELGRCRLGLEVSHLLDEVVVEVGLVDEFEVGAFRIGIRENDIGFDDLAIFEFDTHGSPSIGEDALHWCVRPN